MNMVDVPLVTERSIPSETVEEIVPDIAVLIAAIYEAARGDLTVKNFMVARLLDGLPPEIAESRFAERRLSEPTVCALEEINGRKKCRVSPETLDQAFKSVFGLPLL
jgi:hypothetical protein